MVIRICRCKLASPDHLVVAEDVPERGRVGLREAYGRRRPERGDELHPIIDLAMS